MELRRKAGTPHELERVVIPGPLNVTDEAYGPSWDNSTEVPVKNAIYDKIESLGAAGQPANVNLTNFSLATHPAANGKVLYTTNTPSGGFFWGDAPSGGGGATGFTLTDSVAPTTIHSVTNLTVSVNAGDPIQATLSGTAANANLDFQFTKSPLLVNGSPALWSAPWNLNSTTPAVTDYGFTNAEVRVSGTNATIVIPMRLTFVYTNAASGVFTNPSWGRTIRGYLWGPGGGGGSGRRGLTNTARAGGGGGSSGAYTEFTIANLVGGETYNWTNRPGGVGGASQTVNDSNGNGGGGGSTTSSSTNDVIFGPFVAGGGVGGGPGTTSSGSGGATAYGSFNGTSAGNGASSGSGGGGSSSSTASSGVAIIAGAGGGGGGLSVTDALGDGGPGGTGSKMSYLNTPGSAATSTGASGGSGGTTGQLMGGGGGGGGKSLGTGTAGTGGAGGAGGFPGGGGGGGSAGTSSTGVTGNNSGPGGIGGGGAIVIIVE
jgi:hypothetical protein